MHWEPHRYQLKAIEHAITRADGASALFLDPGLGKTAISLGIITVLKSHGAFKRALILAPRRPMLSTWPQELRKWNQFRGLTMTTAYRSLAERVTALRTPSDIVLAHYDLLVQRYQRGVADIIEHIETETGVFPFDVLILDESTKIKNTDTQRYKALKRIAHKFERRILLTGTPAPNGLHDLFGQITIADNGRRLGANITKFRNEYFVPTFIPGVPVPKWTPKVDAEQRIFAKIGDMAMRMKAEDYITMPERIFNIIKLPIPEIVGKIYRRFERDFIAGVTTGAITAANAAAAATKMRQIASGTVYTDTGTEQLHINKSSLLLGLIDEQNGQPLLVVVAFRSEIEHLRGVLRKAGHEDPPFIIGGVSDATCKDIETRWNRGQIPVLLVHPTTVALGLNLQAGGNAVCWYSLTWNLEEFDQTNRRVWRQGQQAKTCIVHMLTAESTIDERIAATLTEKDASQARLFAALTDHLKEKYHV
jgi:SNF2 family DNA or RNA helicase